MADPEDLNIEELLDSMDTETLMALTSNDIDGICEGLHQSFDTLEERMDVSSFFQEAVAKGFLSAVQEQSRIELASKDREIAFLQNLLKEKDDVISDLQKVFAIAKDEVSNAGNPETMKVTELWDFIHQSQSKCRESEVTISNKEKDPECFDSSLASSSLMLDNESKRMVTLEKQLNELEEHDADKSEQISSFQQHILKLKRENTILTEQAGLKELQLKEITELLQIELQQLFATLERLSQEKIALEKSTEKGTVFQDLLQNYGDLESQVHELSDNIENLMKVEITFGEIFGEQKMLYEVEQDFLVIYVNEQMKEAFLEVITYMDSMEQLSMVKVNNDMSELWWRTDIEASIVEVVMEGWYKELAELVHKLMFELVCKDEEMFYRDGQLDTHKQAVEELENDYATLMSICLALIRDQNDDESKLELVESSVHESGKLNLMGLTEFLSGRDAFGGQEETCALGIDTEEESVIQQLQQGLNRDVISENFMQERMLGCTKYKEIPEELERQSYLHEELASLQLCHSLELEIVSEVVTQNCREGLESICIRDSPDNGSLNAIEKKLYYSFKELEGYLDSAMELETHGQELEVCRMESIRTGCLGSICEGGFCMIQLSKNMDELVNKMKEKLSSVQDTFQQQEWKHMLEDEIMMLVFCDALSGMGRATNVKQTSEQVESKNTLPMEHADGMGPPWEDAVTMFGTERQMLYSFQQSDEQKATCAKAKLVLLLRKTIEDLSKEDGVCIKTFDCIIEELYTLKWQLWKEEEIRLSKLSQPQRKEVKDELDGLSQWSSKSVNIEGHFNKVDEAKFDALAYALRKEWSTEKENLLVTLSQNVEQIVILRAEISDLQEKEKNCKETEAELLTCITGLSVQINNFFNDNPSKELQFAKNEEGKEASKREIDHFLEKGHLHAASEPCTLAQIHELETKIHQLLGHITEIETENVKYRQEIFKHEATVSEFKREIEEKKEQFMRLASEKEEIMVKVDANVNTIRDLDNERIQLAKELLNKELLTIYLTEEREIALASAVKERQREEEKRKMVELQVQKWRLQATCLHDKVSELEGKLKLVTRELDCEVAEQVLKAYSCFEQKVVWKMEEDLIRLDVIEEKFHFLRSQLTRFSIIEANYKQRLAKELEKFQKAQANLQKAETEVDLLADELECLLDILEKVHTTFDLYTPILVHYPKMNEVAKFVKQEVQLRIDQKYGA
ncbi:hypothetical protein KP509_14G025800 [Ceratopteris richardii]|uniref:WPP domain-associated protein n=1 Tax=Ceratopteris richardii TaxID=49495 RepID=A0A8T2T899_CERRI|nr:hypothetical protein KP509_14G025800 [Ceratopteris richardii]